jgi:hypothetical protein
VAYASAALLFAFSKGIEIGWSDSTQRGASIVIRLPEQGRRTRYRQIIDPRTLLVPTLGNQLLAGMEKNTTGLSRLVAAITGGGPPKYSAGRPFRIKIALGKDDLLVTTNGERLTQSGLGNPVYLERELNSSGVILMRWRNLGGAYKTGVLCDAHIPNAVAKIVAASPSMDTFILTS